MSNDTHDQTPAPPLASSPSELAQQVGEDGLILPKLLSGIRGKIFRDLRKDVITWSAESMDLARLYYHARE